jgi:hypothetical protein
VLAIDLELQATLDQPRAANEAQRLLVMDAPCDLAISASCRTRSKASACPASTQAHPYDAEPPLGVELLRGGLPDELRSPSFPPATAKSV